MYSCYPVWTQHEVAGLLSLLSLLGFCNYLSGLCSFQGSWLRVGVAIQAVVAKGQVWSHLLGQIMIALAAGQSPLLEGRPGLPGLL